MATHAELATTRKAKTSEKKESARQAGELAALRRMLTASEGTFSLSFAVFNVVRLRDELLTRLTQEFPSVATVRLSPMTNDILEEVRGQVFIASSCEPDAIFVLDLEVLLSPESRANQILRSLNASRELWEAFRCPIVFWLAEHAATMVASKAVDFWRYRSHSFEFAAVPDIGPVLTEEPFPGYDMIVGLPFEEKMFRRAELERRLADTGDRPSEQMLPHVLSWMYELAEFHEIFHDWKSAETTKRKALSYAESEYGTASPACAIALNNLAQLLTALNRLAEAEPLIRRALAIDEESCGPEHPEVAIRLNNVALLLKATNRMAEAEPLTRRALAIDERFFGAEHPAVAADLNNLAQLLQATNRLAEAEPLMRRALSIDERSYGAKHPKVATSLNNLAQLLETTNRLAEAEPLMRRALAIAEQSYGAEHPLVAATLSNLAQLLQDTNRLSEAEPLMRRALAIDEQSYGPEHPSVARDLTNLARLLQATNRLAEAEPLMRRAIVIDKQSYGADHPRVALGLNNLAQLLDRIKKRK